MSPREVQEGYCPTCKTNALLSRSRRCVWCDTYVHSYSMRRAFVDEDTVQEVHEAHQAGESLRSISRRLHNVTGYSTPHSFLMAMTRESQQSRGGAAARRQGAPGARGIRGHVVSGHVCRDESVAQDVTNLQRGES
jgi:hypothetical protein